MVQVRYIVDDVDAAIEFYSSKLGFELKQQFGAAMAIVTHNDLELWLAGPSASASKPMPDGSQPEPGGWSRFVLPVSDLETLHESLLDQGVVFKSAVVQGPGGKQALCEDPSGNVIELFQAAT